MDKENQKEIDSAIMAVIGQGEEPVVEELPKQQFTPKPKIDRGSITISRVKQLCNAVDGKIDTKYLIGLINRGLAE